MAGEAGHAVVCLDVAYGAVDDAAELGGCGASAGLGECAGAVGELGLEGGCQVADGAGDDVEVFAGDVAVTQSVAECWHGFGGASAFERLFAGACVGAGGVADCLFGEPGVFGERCGEGELA